MRDLSIVIVTWNCREYVEKCIESVLSSTGLISYEIILIDNHSSDGTVQAVASRFPDVRITENNVNEGFARANNQGVSQADGRYILLLNPDTTVKAGALDALAGFLNEHEGAWAVGPNILDSRGRPQNSGVRFPNNRDIFSESLFLDRVFPHSRIFGRHKELYKDQHSPRQVDLVQGSCLMIRSSAIKKVGVLDEQFFMYFEEIDWCFRIKEAGGKVFLFPKATIVHFGGGVIGHFDERRLVHYHKSLLLFYSKHYSPAERIIVRIVLGIRSVIRILAWTAVALFRPSRSRVALSSIRGYMRTFGLLMPGVR